MARGKQAADAQAKNAKLRAKREKGKKGKGDKAKGPDMHKCAICFTELKSSKKNTIKQEEHCDAKHKGKTLYECFPMLKPSAIAATNATASMKPKYKADKPIKEKKKKYKRKG